MMQAKNKKKYILKVDWFKNKKLNHKKKQNITSEIIKGKKDKDKWVYKIYKF